MRITIDVTQYKEGWEFSISHPDQDDFTATYDNKDQPVKEGKIPTLVGQRITDILTQVHKGGSQVVVSETQYKRLIDMEKKLKEDEISKE